MTEYDIGAKLADQERKLDLIYRSVERMRKYFLWTLIVTIAVIVLPAIGLMFAIPAYLRALDFGGFSF